MLREQCDRLTAALAEAQQDNRTLREMSGHVAQRLEGSIVELDRLLGRKLVRALAQDEDVALVDVEQLEAPVAAHEA